MAKSLRTNAVKSVIILTMTVEILRASNTKVLEERVQMRLNNAEGWRIEGAPFEDKARGEWCWTVVLEVKPVAPGGIKLREPIKRAS